MSQQYQCIETLVIPYYDDNGNRVDNKQATVQVGTVWEQEGYAFLGDIHLRNGLAWLDISNETLADHFIKVTQEENLPDVLEPTEKSDFVYKEG